MTQDKQEIGMTTANKSKYCLAPMAIAIDGPAGAGKSTVARMIADRLGFCHIDTGAMYRAVTLAALRRQVDFGNESEIENLTSQMELKVLPDRETMRIMLNGEDITEDIRDPSVSAQVSKIAKLPNVRLRLVSWQRELARSQCVVMDGRDIGSHVLPNAPLKVFLTASITERARRRVQELEAKGIRVSDAQIEAEISYRDTVDSQREASPLIKSPDAVEIDTSNLDAGQVVEKILEIAKARGIVQPTGV